MLLDKKKLLDLSSLNKLRRDARRCDKFKSQLQPQCKHIPLSKIPKEVFCFFHSLHLEETRDLPSYQLQVYSLQQSIIWQPS